MDPHFFNVEEFKKVWAVTPSRVKRTMADWAKYPTERNMCYTSGYLAASNQAGILPDDPYFYLLALIGHKMRGLPVLDAINKAQRED